MSPTAEPKRAIELFYSYAHEDETLRRELEKHLTVLRRQGLITTWHDRDISAGNEWKYEVDAHLNTSKIILLLISSDFMTSDYCYSSEIQQALERHNNGEAFVIPILLRPTDWQGTPFEKLRMLPTNAQPVTSWANRDEAFLDIAKGIQKAAEQLTKTSSRILSQQTASTTSISTVKEPVLPSVWNVPYRRNSFFIGRENSLNYLYKTLIRSKTDTPTLPQAILGPNGVGKTQITIEYAYRYSRNYQAVLWAKGDSRPTLVSDFVTIAGLLNLPEKDEQDQSRAVAAVKRWMEDHTDWLLILDNVENLSIVSDFIPATYKGHILLTMKVLSTGSMVLGSKVQRVKIEKMEPEEGALLLLRLAMIIEPNASLDERIKAQEISKILDGLPLAITLAGASIKETRCSLADYLDSISTLSKELTKFTSEYPEGMAATWTFLLEKLLQTKPTAVELLSFFAFLDPDVIPEEIITEGASELGHTLQSIATNSRELDSLLRKLLDYALIYWDTKQRTFSIHHLIQTILKDTMNQEMQCKWAERTVRAVNRVFPEVEFSTWKRCQRYLPHAFVCAVHIKEWNMAFPEAISLLHRVAYYLKEHGQYSQAELLSTQALDIQEQTLGPKDPAIVLSINNLAEVYYAQGKYTQAELLYQRALSIRQRALGPNHPDVAQSLNNLAMLYNNQGRYSEAEPLFKLALNIRKHTLRPDHPDVATSLNNLALLYYVQGKYDEAEPLFIQALDIREHTLGRDHTDVATSLNNLATLYNDQGKYNEAEPLFKKALQIDQSFYGLSHPNVARDFNNLGGVLEARGDLAGAQAHYERALKIDEKTYGPNHPNIAVDINNLGSILRKLGDLHGAQMLYERALKIDETTYGSSHPNVAIRLNNLGSILQQQGKLEEAQALYERALNIAEAAYGQHHPQVARIVNNLASVLQARGNLSEAQTLYERALTILQTTYGSNHLNVGSIVNSLGDVLQAMGYRAEAEVYYKQAYQIFREHLGEDHPYTVRIVENLKQNQVAFSGIESAL